MIVSAMAGVRSGSLALAGALAMSMVFCVMSGCNPRGTEIKRGVAGTAKLLKPEDEFKYVGKGRAKRKESLSRQERIAKLRQLEKQQKAQE